MSSSRIRWVVGCAAGILLAGCDDGPPASAAAPGIPAKPSKAAPQLPAEMVAAVSSPRNSKVVSVHFVLNGTPTVMKPLPVDVAIVPHEPVLSLIAHFDAREGVSVVTGKDLERLKDPRPEDVIKHQLILLPSTEGVFVVTGVIETETSEGSVSRVFSIPVIVGVPGEPAPDPAPPPPRAASG
jgi:hypothetical protein